MEDINVDINQNPTDKTKVLYDAVSKDYNIGTFDEFSKKLQDPSKREAFYKGVGSEYNLGSYDEFSKKVGAVEKKNLGGTISPTELQSQLPEDKNLLTKVPKEQQVLTPDLSFKSVTEKFPSAPDQQHIKKEGEWKNIIQNVAANIELTGTKLASGGATIIRDLSSNIVKNPDLYDARGNKTKEAEDATWLSDPLGKVVLGLNGNQERMQEVVRNNSLPSTYWGNAVSAASEMTPDLLATGLMPEAKAAQAASAISKIGSLAFNNFTKYLALKGGLEGYSEEKQKGGTAGEAIVEGGKQSIKGIGTGIEMALLGAGSNVATKSIMKQAEMAGLTGVKGLVTKELVNLGTDVAAFGLLSPYSHAALEGRFATGKEIADGTGIAALFRIKGGLENLKERGKINKALNELQDFRQGVAISNFVDATPESIKEVYNGKESADELNLKALQFAKAAKETNDPETKQLYVAKAITYTKASNVKQVADMVINNKEGYSAFEQSDLPDDIKQSFLGKAAQINKEVNPIEQQKTDLGNKIKQGEQFVSQIEKVLPQYESDPVQRAELTFKAEQAKKQVESYNKDLMKLIETQNEVVPKKEESNIVEIPEVEKPKEPIESKPIEKVTPVVVEEVKPEGKVEHWFSQAVGNDINKSLLSDNSKDKVWGIQNNNGEYEVSKITSSIPHEQIEKRQESVIKPLFDQDNIYNEGDKINIIKPAKLQKNADGSFSIRERGLIRYGEKELPKEEVKPVISDIEKRRNALPELQASNTRTPATKAVLDYFAETVGIPKFTEDLSKGTYLKWLQDANNLGDTIAHLLEHPRRAFDEITKYGEEIKKFKPKEEVKPTEVVSEVEAKPTKEVYDRNDTPIKIDDIGEGFVLHRGGKGVLDKGFHSIDKIGAEGYAGDEGKLTSSAIKKDAKILKLVSGNSENYSDNAKDIDEFYRIIGEKERKKGSEWATGENPSDITTRLWDNKSAQEKLKKAGIDIVIGNTIDGVDAFVVNENALEKQIPAEEKGSEDVEVKQQIENFGVNKKDVEPIHSVISQVFNGLKKAGLTAAKTVGDWVGIGKGEEKPYSLKIDGKDTKVKNVQPEVVNGFYSPLEKIVTDSKFDKLPAKQWIEKYANSEEAKWTGLKDWLAQQKGSVSKADIQQYLKDNRISVVEVVKGGKAAMSKSEAAKVFEDKGYDVITDRNGDTYVEKNEESFDYNDMSELEQEAFDILTSNNLDRINTSNDTKYSDLQVGGQKEGYKEVLVTMPSKSKLTLAKFLKDLDISNEEYNLRKKSYDLAYEQEVNKQSEKFKSSHFDEPNILVHLRMNTRTDAKGNKVLFLEEVQSDWGQKGKKEGFKEDWKAIKDGDMWVGKNSNGELLPNLYGNGITRYTTKEAIEDAIKSRADGLPNAPFVTDTNAWTKLGLKVALKEAVAQGADKIAWTTGEQQNDRYDLSNHYEKVSYKIDGVAASDNAPMYEITTFKKGGAGNGTTQGSYRAEELENVVGKEVAEKIINGEGNKFYTGKDNKLTSTELSGLDLKVGGKGMKGFYGSPTEGSLGIVGSVAKSLFKQEPKITEIQIEKQIENNSYENNLAIATKGNKTYRLFYDSPHKEYVAELYDKDSGEGIDIVDIGEHDTELDAMNAFKKKFPNAETIGSYAKKKNSSQYSIDITPELKASVEGGQPLFRDAEAQYRIESGKNIVEAIKDFNGSPRATIALTHEIMHPTVVAIIDGAKESNEVGLKHAETIVSEFNKVTGQKVTIEDLIKGNDAFKEGTTSKQYRAVQEFIARSWEKYHKEGGKGFSAEFQKVLNQITEAFQSVYKSLTGKQLTPELRKMFDDILGKEQLKTKENAIQEPSTSSVLQYPQEGARETGGERGRMEPSKQGEAIAEKGKQVEGNEEEVKPKEYTSKTGRQKIVYDEKGNSKVIDTKTGKEVSRETAKKVFNEAADNYDFSKGKKASFEGLGEGDLKNEKEGDNYVIDNSSNPTEIAEIYARQELEPPVLNSAETAIVNHGIGKVDVESFKRFNDKNNITFGLAKNWFQKGGKGSKLDAIAEEISEKTGVNVTPEDIGNFMVRFPSGAKAEKLSENQTAYNARNKFEKLTGLPLTEEIAHKAIDYEFNKLTKEQQAIAEQDFKTRKQLEDAYWAEQPGAIKPAPEKGDNIAAKQAAKAEKGLKEPIVEKKPLEGIQKEYQEVINKTGERVREKAKLEFVERNFDSILNKLKEKIKEKCPT